MNGVLGMLDLVIRSRASRAGSSSSLTWRKLRRDTAEAAQRHPRLFQDRGRGWTSESTPFSFHDNLGDSLKSLAVQVHEKGLELSCSIAPNVPEGLVGDPGRLSQVVANLVGNAKKFTERGRNRGASGGRGPGRRGRAPARFGPRYRCRDPARKVTALSSARSPRPTAPRRGNMAVPASGWRSAHTLSMRWAVASGWKARWDRAAPFISPAVRRS